VDDEPLSNLVEGQPFSNFAEDACRFIGAFSHIIETHALHVYQSALRFVPRKTALWHRYGGRCNKGIRVILGANEEWDSCTHILAGHTGTVISISVSPDGTRLASGSYDNATCIWDARSGAAIGRPLQRHSGQVNSVVFSPDGTRLASVTQHSQTVMTSDILPLGQRLRGWRSI
jgi:WD40 repeat protein